MKLQYSADGTSDQDLSLDWGSLRWLANSAIGNTEETAVAYVVIRQGRANTRHRHNCCEEILHLLRGELEHSIGDDVYHLQAGDTLTIPAGVFHNAVSKGEVDAHMVVIYSSPERDFELESPDAVHE